MSERRSSSFPPAFLGDVERSYEEMLGIPRHDRLSSANTTRLLSTPNSNQTNGSGTRMPAEVSRESVMSDHHGSLARCSSDGRSVQVGITQDCAEERYRPVTPEQATAFAALRRVSGPLTIPRVSAALGWSESRARRWLRFFAAKGLLDAGRTGHRWRAA
jgi:hypothetical protein